MSIDPAAIARLADLMERHGIATLDYDLGGASLSLRMPARVSAGQQPALPNIAHSAGTGGSNGAAAPAGRTITAVNVGFFRASHPGNGAPPELPRVIKTGEIIGYVEALGLVHAVTADTGGTLVACRVADGEPVGYGTVLFDLAP